MGRDGITRSQKSLLVELANLRDDGMERLRHHAKFTLWLPSVPDTHLLGLRNALRALWSGEPPERVKLLDSLALALPSDPGRIDTPHWIPSFDEGHMVPNPYSAYAQLIQTVLDQHTHFGVCGNPGCPAPYFLKKRKDNRHCEQGPCTAYAQQQHALKWWNKEGNKRRSKRAKAAKTSNRQSTTKRRQKG